MIVDNGAGLIHCFILNHPAEAAQVLEKRSLDEQASFFAATPSEITALLFDAMEAGSAAVGARCSAHAAGEAGDTGSGPSTAGGGTRQTPRTSAALPRG
jgi:hypothetical protein